MLFKKRAGFWLYIFLYLVSTTVSGKHGKLEKNWEMAKYFYITGAYREAEAEALYIVSKKKNRKDIDRTYIDLLLLQAKSLKRQFRFKEANKISSKAEGYVKILARNELKTDGIILLCNYHLEEGNVAAAKHFFEMFIPDSLIVPVPVNRFQAEATLVKAKILEQQGYLREANPLLIKAGNFFRNHNPEVSIKERYFIKENLNNEVFNEKYAESQYYLALVQLNYGEVQEAEKTLLDLTVWVSKLEKENPYRHRPWSLLAILYKQKNLTSKYLKACSRAYTENPNNDNEFEKQAALLKCNLAFNESKNFLEAKSYFRRLELKAMQNIGLMEPSQLAYDLAESQLLFVTGEYKTALARLKKTDRYFSFVPDNHPYRLVLGEMNKDLLFFQGDLAGYQTLLEKEVKVKSKFYGNDAPEYHHSRMKLALHIVKYGKDLEKAEFIIRQSYFKLLYKEIGFSSRLNIEYLQGIAVFFKRTGKYDSSVVMLEKAFESSNAFYGNDAPISLTIQCKLSEALLYAGKYDAFKISLNKVIKTIEDINTAPEFQMLSYYYQLAHISRIAGELTKSNTCFNALKRISNKIGLIPLPIKLEIDADHAALYYDQGNFYRAGKTCASIRSEGGKQTYWIFSLRNTEARVHVANGNFAAAEVSLNEAMQNTAESSFERSEVLLSKGDYLIAISDYFTALEQVKEADNIREKTLGVDHFYRFETLTRIAYLGILMNSKNLLQIEKSYRTSLSLVAKALGEENLAYFYVEQKLAEFYFYEKRYQDALQLLSKELEYSQKSLGDNHPNTASLKSLIGSIHYTNRNYPTSEQFLLDAAKTYRSRFSEKHPEFLKVQSKLARLYYMQQESGTALAAIESVVKGALEYSRLYFSSLSFRQRNRFWNSFKEDFEFYTFLNLEVNKSVSSRKLKDLYDIVIATKGMLLNSDIKLRKQIMAGKDTSLSYLFKKWVIEKELLTYTMSLSSDEQKDQELNPKYLEQRIEQLEKDMGSRSDIFRKGQKINNIRSEDVQASLDENEYAVEVVRYRTFNETFTDSVKYAALILNKNADPQFVILPNGAFLEKRLLNYYRNNIIYKNIDELSFANYWQPIKEKIPDGSKIFFSSEGVYNQINLETLKDDAGKYQIERNDIVMLTNTKDLVSFDNNEHTTNKKGAFILCGNPAFYTLTATGNIESLDGAEKEVRLLQAIAQKNRKNTQVFINEEVQESTIKKISNPMVFHIATHGYFKEETNKNLNQEDYNPLLNSGLMLSGSGDILIDKENLFINKKDGILTAYEALDLNFDETELVILSACETGRGDVQIGEGVFGLQRTFLIAGAKAVILSLFKVDDEVTQELMGEFYEKWFLTGNARTAFTSAKLKIKEKYKDPVFWGAFMMIESEPKTSSKIKGS